MPSTNTRPPFQAYKGTEPYLFISYAHKDSEVVFPELIRMKAMGLNLWYDEGIDPGNEWPDEIANALRGSSIFVYFVSPNSVRSANCRDEVYFAKDHKKPFLNIFIEETNIAQYNAGLALSIGSLQAVMKYQMDAGSYERKLKQTLDKLLPGSSIPELVPTEGPILKPQAAKGPPLGVIMAIVLVPLLVLVVGATLGAYFGLQRHKEVVTVAGSDSQQSPQKDNEQTKDNQPTPTETPAVGPQDGQEWQNSLGMKFVPAGTPNVLFSIFDTRVADFQAFAQATGFDSTDWKNPGFTQGPDHPVVSVSWTDAKAFCKWLTDKEHFEGVLGKDQSYRLPTDVEWSKAAGLDEPDGTPDTKTQEIKGVFPWGTDYPPTPGAGNYNRKEDGRPDSTDTDVTNCKDSDIPGTDGFPYTSPVGSFKANQNGLYDMGGNVDQWCEDWYDDKQKTRVLRGSDWDDNQPNILGSSCRTVITPDTRNNEYGFRIVVVVAAP